MENRISDFRLEDTENFGSLSREAGKGADNGNYRSGRIASRPDGLEVVSRQEVMKVAMIDVDLCCQKCDTSLHPYYLTDKRRVFICPACHLLYLVVIEILPIQEKEAMG